MDYDYDELTSENLELYSECWSFPALTHMFVCVLALRNRDISYPTITSLSLSSNVFDKADIPAIQYQFPNLRILTYHWAMATLPHYLWETGVGHD